MNRLEEILKYEMDDMQAAAFKMSLMWEKLCPEQFPDADCSRLRKKGDPRKSNLFRYCYKLVRETNGLIDPADYKLYILSQLHILKINKGRVDPNCLCGDKAWRRWQLWKSHYDKKNNAYHATQAAEDTPNFRRIKTALKDTKKYLDSKGVNTLEAVTEKLKDRSLIRWVTNAKINPIWAVLSPELKEALGDKNLSDVFKFDFSVYKSSITPEIEVFYKQLFHQDGTTVVNFRKEKCDVKICRKPDNSIPDPPELGCFGNPYSEKKYGRERCIALFEEYFLKRVEEDKAFREAVLSLKGKRLGCFCKPLACHGDVIKQWLDQ